MTVQEAAKPIEILLVEDNPDDVDLLRESLKGVQMPHHLNVAEDGEAALAYLKGEGAHARPDVILLDLKLPRKSGHEVLREIKDDESLKRIPVVVLTTSQDERDVLKAYNHHASCYVVKPMDLTQLLDVARWLDDWFKVVKLPK